MFHICDVEWMYLCVWRFFAPETSEGLRPKLHIYTYIYIYTYDIYYLSYMYHMYTCSLWNWDNDGILGKTWVAQGPNSKGS